jgi:hypothetical protein
MKGYFAPDPKSEAGLTGRLRLAYSRWRLLRKAKALAIRERQSLTQAIRNRPLLAELKQRGLLSEQKGLLLSEMDSGQFEREIRLLEFLIEGTQDGDWGSLRVFMDAYEQAELADHPQRPKNCPP